MTNGAHRRLMRRSGVYDRGQIKAEKQKARKLKKRDRRRVKAFE